MDTTTQSWNFMSTYLATELSSTISYENSSGTLPPECLGAPDVRYNDTYLATGYSYETMVILSVVVGLFCLYVLLGNVAVIVVILRDRVISLQPQNQYLISLAVADALLAVLVIPFTLVNELSGKWPFGAIYCQIYLATDVLLCTASIWNICAIGLDRYWSVKRPVDNQKKRTKKVIRIIILTVWALSFAICVLPFIFGFQTIPIASEESCFINDADWYILSSCTLSFFLPVTIIAPVYTKIYLIGRKHSRPVTSPMTKISKRKEVVTGSHPNNNAEDLKIANSVKAKQKIEQELASKHSLSSNEESSVSEHDNQKRLEYSCLYTTKNGKLSLPTQVHKNGSSVRVDLICQKEQGDLLLKPVCDVESKADSPSKKRLFSAPSSHNALSMASLLEFFKRKNRRESEPMSKKAAYYHKRERRFTIIICIVTGGFLICWYPFFQTYVAYAICRKSCCINKVVFKAVFWLGYLNSGLNPAIYTIFNKEFRRAFRRLIC